MDQYFRLGIASRRISGPAGGAVTSLAWVMNGQPAYALEALINYCAATLNWMRDQLGIFRDLDEFERLADGVNDNGGVVLVPAFVGLSGHSDAPTSRAPRWTR